MPEIFVDQDYLRKHQYRQGNNLDARILLHKRYSTNPQGWYNWMFQQIDLQPGMDVLEVGCGTGEFWRAIQDQLPQEISITVADLSIGMVEECRSSLAGDLRFQYIHLDAQQIPLPEHSFDLIFANHMLYHVPDKELAIAEFRRVLKPGGKLCAATNGLGHLAEMHQLIETTGVLLPITTYAARRFGLENGPGYLLGAFQSVKRMDYLDSLWVTEVQPLLDYLQSMWTGFLFQEQMDQLKMEIEQRIQTDGGIVIRKSGGALLAEGYSTSYEGMK